MSYVFISYSHENKGYAHRLQEALKLKGFEVWLDDRIDYGTQWPKTIQEKLDGCKALILIMTARSYDSDWVQSELSRAKRKRKNIFPLLLEGNEPWLSVEATQYVDVRGGKLPPTAFYDTLANAVPRKKKIPPNGTLGEKEQKTEEIVSELINLKKTVMDTLSTDIYLEVGRCQVTYMVFFSGKLFLTERRKDKFFASAENRTIQSKLTDLGWANSGWQKVDLGDFLLGLQPEEYRIEFNQTFKADAPNIADLLIATMGVFSMRPSEINVKVKYKLHL